MFEGKLVNPAYEGLSSTGDNIIFTCLGYDVKVQIFCKTDYFNMLLDGCVFENCKTAKMLSFDFLAGEDGIISNVDVIEKLFSLSAFCSF
jgi:hypothetical protein